MKEINRVFFGEKGITSTSANHLANLAKECMESNRRALEGVGFITSTVRLLNGGEAAILTEGRNEQYLSSVPELLKEIAEMNTFCAWMREAIKAKDEELSLIDNANLCDYFEDLPETPERGIMWNEKDAIATFSIAERMEYYSLEAEAATLGKFIHPDKPFSVARTDMMKRMVQPNKLVGEGVNAMMYHFVPSISSDLVEDYYMQLQQKHRNVEGALNKYKYRIKKLVEEHNLELERKYRDAREVYNMTMQTKGTEFRAWQIEERSKIAALKIVIPEALTKTYEKLSLLRCREPESL